MSKTQNLVDQSNLEEGKKAIAENLRLGHGAQSGILNTEIREPLPNLTQAPCETVYPGKNNSFVILGRDRPQGRATGFGGAGGTQCGRLDLCVGVGSSYKRKDNSFGPPNSETLLDPSFVTTASRIYITQRGHIDKYMGLAEAKGFSDSENRSAIGIKSDCIRIHGRQDIKIITGKSKFEGLGKSGERLASGGEIDGVGTISFIAGNYTDDEKSKSFSIWNPRNVSGTNRKKLQPLVKGQNLVDALVDLTGILHELNNRIIENSKRIDNLSNSYQNHMHEVTAGFGGPSSPSMAIAMAGSMFTKILTKIDRVHLKTAGKQIDAFRNNFLEMGPSNMYINSKYVFTT